MSRFMPWIVAVMVSLATLPVAGRTTSAAVEPHQAVSPLAATLIRLAAGRIDDTLAAVAASTQSLAATFRNLSGSTPAVSPRQRTQWTHHAASKGNTVAFFDEESCGADLKAQAPCPAFLSYGGKKVTEATFRQLAIMNRLAPAMAAAHGAFPFSWVYFTTPQENFCIYPYLPLDQAVHNDKPTDKAFYRAADFERRACGWESPYLDLAGAGMMVTVSCPAYDGDTLLGVASRDITLSQLSSRVLADLTDAIPGARVAVMNRRGKAIAASDPEVAHFISTENAKAGDAIVYFRADRGLTAMSLAKAVDSPDDTLNGAAEAVIERVSKKKAAFPMVFRQGPNLVLAARVHTTGWYLVLLVPEKASH